MAALFYLYMSSAILRLQIFMEVSEQLTGFELEDLMSWTVSNLQRPFREDFSLEKSGIIAEKVSQIFGRRFVGFDS